MCQAFVVLRRLHDTGQAVRVRGTYVTRRHLVYSGSQAERGLTTPSGRGTSAGADIAVTAISVPPVTLCGAGTERRYSIPISHVL